MSDTKRIEELEAELWEAQGALIQHLAGTVSDEGVVKLLETRRVAFQELEAEAAAMREALAEMRQDIRQVLIGREEVGRATLVIWEARIQRALGMESPGC